MHSLDALRPGMLFFGCRIPEKLTRDASLKSMWTVVTPGIQLGKETHLRGRAYLCILGHDELII